MINPIRFLWKQFIGSQINAIAQGMWLYFKETFDPVLEYFRTLSPATASENDLTDFGAVHGLARPLIPIPDEKYMVFTEEYDYVLDEETGRLVPASDYPSARGFNSSEWDNPSPQFNTPRDRASSSPTYTGGVFDYEKSPEGYKYLPAYIFRAFLQGSIQSEGYLGSLIALDDMLNAAWKAEHSRILPIYRIDWVWDSSVTRFTPGDVKVDLGVTGDWVYPYEVQAEVKLLGQTVYYPIPKLLPILIEGDSRVDPYGFIRILTQTEGSVYGLDAMWEGIGTPSDTVDDGTEPEFSVLPITETELNLMWLQDNTWIDEEAPALEFASLSVDKILEMW